MKKILILMIMIIEFVQLSSAQQGFISDPGLKFAADGMSVYENAFNSMMNNAVNSTTPGYKEIGVSNVSDKNGVKNIVFYRFFQGSAIQSGGSLDFIIEGPGFFVLKCPWGNGYTRDGRFTLESDGRLVTLDKHFPVMGENGEIYIGAGSLSVDESGAILAGGQFRDLFRIVQLTYAEKLVSLNGSIFYFEDVSMEQQSNTTIPYKIKKGYYEASNVDLSSQMAQLPIVKNVYDANTKAVKNILKSLNAGISIGNPQ